MSVYVLFDVVKRAHLLAEALQIPYGTSLSAADGSDVVIPWNRTVDLTKGPRTLNAPPAVRLCGDKAAMRKALSRSGVAIKTPGQDSAKPVSCRSDRIYVVPVFFPEALAVLSQPTLVGVATTPAVRVNSRTLAAASRETRGDERRAEAQRAARQAVRAVRALDLDFANVVLSANGLRPPAVVDVEPYPALNRKLALLYAGAFNRFSRRLENGFCDEHSVLMGADPEFALVSRRGDLVPASSFLPLLGKLGCDSVVRRDGTVFYPLAEIRPSPAAEPDQLAAEIRKLLAKAANRIAAPDLRWLAGGMPVDDVTLGGHIHFSGVWPDPFLIRALDNYLALPLAAIEDEHAARRRPRYGYPGDVRLQFHGGFEYRTLPSWLVSPEIALAVLHLAKLIVESYRQLRQTPLSDEQMQIAFYRGNVKVLGDMARRLWEELAELPAYAQRQERLEPLRRMIFARERWDEQRDIRDAWGIAGTF